MKTIFLQLIVAINLLSIYVVQAQETPIPLTKFEQQVWIAIFESKVREAEKQGIRIETQTAKETDSIFNEIRSQLPKTN